MLGRKEERKKELDQQEGPLLINFCVAFKDHARIPPVFLSPPFFPPSHTAARTNPGRGCRRCARRKRGAKLLPNTAQCSRWMWRFKPGANRSRVGEITISSGVDSRRWGRAEGEWAGRPAAPAGIKAHSHIQLSQLTSRPGKLECSV